MPAPAPEVRGAAGFSLATVLARWLGPGQRSTVLPAVALFGLALGLGFGLASRGSAVADPAPAAELANTQRAALDALAFRLAVVERRIGSGMPTGEAPAAPGDAVLVMLAAQEIQDRIADGSAFSAAVAALRGPLGRLDPDARMIDQLALHAERGVPSMRRIELGFVEMRRLLEEQAFRQMGSALGQVRFQASSLLAALHLAERPEPGRIRSAVTRIDAALREADLATAYAVAMELDGIARDILDPWLVMVRARLQVLGALEGVRQRAWRGIVGTSAP